MDIYEVYMLTEVALYVAATMAATVLALYLLAHTWLVSVQALGQVQHNRHEWEQQRQGLLRTEEEGNELHQYTVEFFRLDDWTGADKD